MTFLSKRSGGNWQVFAELWRRLLSKSGRTVKCRCSSLDTSALAKYYRRELGSDVIEQLFAISGVQRVVSRLALVEMESVFALKVRTGEINRQAAPAVRQRLEADLGRRQVLVAAVRDEHFQAAKLLIMKHGPDMACVRSTHCSYPWQADSSVLVLLPLSWPQTRSFVGRLSWKAFV